MNIPSYTRSNFRRSALGSPQRRTGTGRRRPSGRRRTGGATSGRLRLERLQKAVVVALAVAAVLGTWFLLRPTSPGSTPACGIVVDVDQGTTEVPGLLAQYKKWVSAEVTACAERGANLVVVPATADSESSPVLPVVQRFDEKQTGNSSADLRAATKSAKELLPEVSRRLNAAASRSTKGGTDLIGALVVVGQQLPERKKGAPCVVTIFSDGISTGTPNLSAAPLDRDGINRIVKGIRESGRLPALRGCKVSVVGAGVGKWADELGPERLQAVRRFWSNFADASGARLDGWSKAAAGMP